MIKLMNLRVNILSVCREIRIPLSDAYILERFLDDLSFLNDCKDVLHLTDGKYG
jgi:hypothetical protein